MSRQMCPIYTKPMLIVALPALSISIVGLADAGQDAAIPRAVEKTSHPSATVDSPTAALDVDGFECLPPSATQWFAPEDDGLNSAFGWAVAMSGDLALIGFPNDADQPNDGGSIRAYRYKHTKWYEHQTLTTSDLTANGSLGRAIALDGDLAVMGASGRNRAFVFRYDGDQWVEELTLAPPAWAGSTRFGRSVGIDDEVIVVGGDFHGYLQSCGIFAPCQPPAAFVYRFDGTAWVLEAELAVDEIQDGDGFGIDVAVRSNVAVVGAYARSNNGVQSGAAYAYRYTDGSPGSWSFEAKLTPSDGEADDHFGESVAVEGSTILVGAHFEDEAGPEAGAVYEYEYTGGSWVEQSKILPVDWLVGESFGGDVAISGELAVIGAPRYLATPRLGEEPAALYRRLSTGWVPAVKLGLGLCDLYGRSVAISGDRAVIGAPLSGEYICGLSGPGAAIFFSGLGDCDSNGGTDICDSFWGVTSDCNTNDVPDACDISEGLVPDRDGNGVPDSCELATSIMVATASEPIQIGGRRLALDLTESNVEPRIAGVDRLVVELSFAVSQVDVAVSCANHDYSGAVTTNVAGPTVTVEFSPALPNADCCTVTLAGDVNQSFDVRPLAGDVNRDGAVTTADASIIKAMFNKDPVVVGAQYDLDGNGAITTADYSQVKPRINHTAAPCE